jgi:hypothetical protein
MPEGKLLMKLANPPVKSSKISSGFAVPLAPSASPLAEGLLDRKYRET